MTEDPFTVHSGLLFTVAYEMLGSAADAEDVLQESWLRWAGADRSAVRDPRSYLVKIVTRQALNRLRTLSRSREEYVGEWLPEPLLTSPDVAEDVELAESVSIAMLTVLETLRPAERAVFVLREVFEVPYGEIAEAIGKPVGTVRQIARRARGHVAARRPRMRVKASEQRAVMERFLAALRTGRLQELMEILAPDVVLIADGGGIAAATLAPVHGAAPVAKLLAHASQYAFSSTTVWLNGEPAGRIEVAGEPATVSIAVADGRVTRVYLVRNPRKLTRLDQPAVLSRQAVRLRLVLPKGPAGGVPGTTRHIAAQLLRVFTVLNSAECAFRMSGDAIRELLMDHPSRFSRISRISRRQVRSLLIVGPLLVLVAGLVGAPTQTPARASTGTIRPAATGGLDCNGFSPMQHPVKPGGMVCAEVHGGSPSGHLYDNGHYIGHDEPTLQFYSNQPGSSTDLSWTQTLPRDPRALPTVSKPGKDVTHFFELMPAMWYSMDLCDPSSYPQLPCQPDSDTNTPSGSFPGGGSAFLELQFYPPGFAPMNDAISCDGTHWCAALTIDSLECTNGFTSCNPDCIEPVNFAFIATNGVPAGPPSPQLQDPASVTPNQHTLRMNQGDRLKVHIFDNRHAGALETSIRDLTTGQTGYMIASAANGFASTSIADCHGTPWSFRPLYSTASHANQGGWALANINVAYEIGHFTPCTSLSDPFTIGVGDVSDQAFNLCNGPYEDTTSPDPGSAAEPSDGPCFQAGDTHGGLNSAPDLATGCTGGDLDYDGTSYWPDWPSSTTPGPFPAPMLISQPRTLRNAPYPEMQFLTDNPATNSACGPATLASCVVPPPQAPGAFYPFWTLASASHGNGCAWEFGQMTNGNTFGGVKQYGPPTILSQIINLGVMDESPIMPNHPCRP